MSMAAPLHSIMVAATLQVPSRSYYFNYPETVPLIDSTNSDIVFEPLLYKVPTKVIIVGCYGWPQKFQRIFVIPESWIEARTNLARAMEEFFAKEHAQSAVNLELGESYTVFFKGIWNRVRLMSRVDSAKAKLNFYDEGIIRKMYVDRIKLIPGRFLSLPSLVLEVKFLRQQPPAIFKGNVVFLSFNYVVRHSIWIVDFITDYYSYNNCWSIMGTAVDRMVRDWSRKAGELFPHEERLNVSCMANLAMKVDDYIMTAPSSPFPVVVIHESLCHLIVTPVAWLNELDNMVKCLPGIAAFSKKFSNHHLHPGASCLVPYAGGWFRARIRSIDNSAAVFALKVRLIDLGIMHYIDRFQARALPRPLVPSYKPPLCFAVKKTPELTAVPNNGFCVIILHHKDADDQSWVAHLQ